MKQLDLLKRIVARANVFSSADQRAKARVNLTEKIRRRDVKVKNNTQLKLPL
jgi:hypothetical protein